MAQPLISIITISYNCADAIEKTIRSVLAQRYTDFEYIIIDGGSTDGTSDIICRHNPHLAYWVSEKDRGISDAFNKGIAAARGQYINLLNAGDSFASPYTLEELAPHLTAPIVTFRYKEENSGEYSRLVDEGETNMEKKALLGHQATFVHRDVYTAMGGYNGSYKIRMDFDFFLRVLPYYVLKSVDLDIVRYNAGLSGNIKHRVRYEVEGLISAFLNGKKSNGYMLRMLYQPLWRVGVYSLKRTVKKALRLTPPSQRSAHPQTKIIG
ncbi:MAG TPA: glycosyltransferase family 2 protein [Puia sp.]|nr:glycosyltransferase family 2 protein [Puia sp.]